MVFENSLTSLGRTNLNDLWLWTWLVAGLTLLFFVYRFALRPTSSLSFPPGPKGWPIIGNLFDFPKTDQAHCFRKMADQYGVYQCCHKADLAQTAEP